LLEEHDLGPKILQVINAKLSAHGLMLKTGTVVDATLISAPSSTKNKTGKRDPAMHQTKKGNQWHFGMKCHIGVDADSSLVHSVIGTAANVNDVTRCHGLLHGEEQVVFADAGYKGAKKREEASANVDWHIAMRPGKRKQQKHTLWGALTEQAEKLKASVRAKVEHPCRQAPIRIRQGALSRVEEEHGTTHDAVRFVEYLDGQRQTFAGSAGMSASENRQSTAKRAEYAQIRRNIDAGRFAISSAGKSSLMPAAQIEFWTWSLARI
jgi:IS5 family transposase